jgi:hypothetical protein
MMKDLPIEKFVSLESAVWKALMAGDAQADNQLLTEDFVGVYPTGIASRSDHVDQLADGPTIESFAILDARILVVAPTAVMLSYRAEFRRPNTSHAAPDEVMFVSSLWCEREGQWCNIFSQDTPSHTSDPHGSEA